MSKVIMATVDVGHVEITPQVEVVGEPITEPMEAIECAPDGTESTLVAEPKKPKKSKDI